MTRAGTRKISGVLIEGYTDPVGAGLTALEKRKGENRQVPKVIAAREKRLIQLSTERAAFMGGGEHQREGARSLSRDQFAVFGRGGEKPITTEEDADRWKNRRVEVTIIPVEAE